MLKKKRIAIGLALRILAIFVLVFGGSATLAATTTSPNEFFSTSGKIVTEATYPLAETARQMLQAQALAGGVNRFMHRTRLTPTDDQPVVRMNRDSYYSMAVVDVSAGASVRLPDVPAGKYMSMETVTEDHRVQPMSYGGGTYELATHTGTHIYVILRFDSTFSSSEVVKYQQQTKIAAGSNELFRAEPVNPASFEEVELNLKLKLREIALRDGVRSATLGMFTAPTDSSRGMYSPEKHQIGAAVGWGGAQPIDNIYEASPSFPAEGCYQATFEDPENHAFWSFTVYNKQGFMFDDVANVNSEQATPNADGTYTVSLGCGQDAPNRIPIVNESEVFNVTVRHYRPSDRVLDGYRLAPTIKKMP